MCLAARRHYGGDVARSMNPPITDPALRGGTARPRAGTKVLATTAALVGMVEAAIVIALVVANRAEHHGLASFDFADIVVPITFGIVGALVASRQPRNPTGWLFLFIGNVAGIQGVADQYARFAYLSHPGAAGGIWALWLDSWVIQLVFPIGALALLLLHFPNGQLPSPRWRPVRIAAVVLTLVVSIASAFSAGPLSTETNFATPMNPVGLGGHGIVAQVLEWLGGICWLSGLALLVAVAAAPLIRMRRSQGDERQQLKWIAYAVIVSATTTVGLQVAGAFISGFSTASPTS